MGTLSQITSISKMMNLRTPGPKWIKSISKAPTQSVTSFSIARKNWKSRVRKLTL